MDWLWTSSATEGQLKDYQASLEKLRSDAIDARLIADLATDKSKRETFAKLAEHFTALVDEVERAMNNQKNSN